MMTVTWPLLVAAALLSGGGLAVAQSPAHDDQKPRTIDFTDPTYGGRIRQIYNPAGDEHNLYHYRCVFNADNSRLLGIETPAGSTDYQVTLYDGDGRFVDGQSCMLARTGTTCGANFWAQPQQSPSADGTRVLFHTNGTCAVGKIGYESSGSIDQCILYLKK